jgi:DNA recombination-dependent growth factor C
MALIRGAGSFTRFWVEGQVPEDYLEEFPKRILRFAFRDIDEASDQERAVGWVTIMDMFDSEFKAMEYLKEPCIAVSWRVDVRKVPAKALLRYCREAENRIKAAEELEYLPKPRRREIREMVKARLLRRVIPSSRAYDVIWNLPTGMLMFGSTSNKLADEFAEFFLNCFDMRLNAVFPYSIASRLLQAKGLDAELLDGLIPAVVPEAVDHAAH